MSNYEKVLEFTEASGFSIPDKPCAMSRSAVEFIIRMVQDELAELLSTVAEPNEDILATMRGLVGANYKPLAKPVDDFHCIVEQSDALVDACYYIYNTATKHAMDIDRVFAVVHQANMDKRFPDGEFHRDAMGKIIKPPGWKEGDVAGEIARQMDV